MSAEEIKKLFRGWFEEIWNQGKAELLDDALAPDFVNHTPKVPFGPDRESYKKSMLNLRKAFPDAHFTVEDIVVEGDRAIARYTFTGTNTGDSANFPATGKTVKFLGFTMLRLRNGQAVEEWGAYDSLDVMQQLGLIPVPGAQPATA